MICKICNKKFKMLSIHISSSHKNVFTKSEYYDKFLKKDKKEGQCINCGKQTKYLNFKFGYRKYCSNSCVNKSLYVKEKRKKTFFQNYGVENIFQSKNEREKMKQTLFKNYGVYHPMESNVIKEKIKQTNIKRYGNEWQIASKKTVKKIKKTNILRYGFENPRKNKFIIQKIKKTIIEKHDVYPYVLHKDFLKKSQKTSLKKFGFNHHMKNNKQQEKQQSSAYTGKYITINKKKYWTQGYEDIFLLNLKKFGFNYDDIIENKISIEYFDPINKKNRHYTSDFQFNDNTHVEIKSKYTWSGTIEKRVINLSKMKATVNMGFKFFLVIFDGRNKNSFFIFEWDKKVL